MRAGSAEAEAAAHQVAVWTAALAQQATFAGWAFVDGVSDQLALLTQIGSEVDEVDGVGGAASAEGSLAAGA